MLINPVSDLLQEPEIIIVPDRILYRVPFAALLDKNGKYLSETFRIRIIPSLTTLKLIQDSPADYHSQTGALIVGDPDVGEVIYCGSLNRKFVSLPGARKEAEMIGRLLGVEPLLGQHATKQAVLQRIESVSLIHFAAHGNAERGEIALSPASTTTGIPQEDDYLLKMSDISQVQLRAKLVVLSCCHSCRGQIRAEGVVGIARAFLGSGARSVLAALWALEDSGTKQFMSCFYEHLVRGESASESLHKAMMWMRDNGFNKVSEWAPFMLIGDNVTFNFKKIKFYKKSLQFCPCFLERVVLIKRRNRSSTSSGDETSPLHEAKKPRDLAEATDESTSSEPEANDEIMDALNKIEHIGEQLRNSIIARLSKLDSIESSVRNIETNLANLKARTAKLEEFEATTKSDIAELKKSCTFNGDKCKERQDELKKKIEGQNEKIASLIEGERKLTAQINDVISKNLYLEAYSRRENIKYFNIPEARRRRYRRSA
ncbi:hypothetical protein ACROYT_G033897 [Oculina patagonica]